ncbi:LysR family transcriptional regulator [Hyphomicrobium sp. D-2]|uniref:LysR family transcriptional regulator n=1 Tax=Hyphomicrobium sp. D-2 TaxID=3041621 RepID=UPI002454D827|nr:LysR family transcriptional regulator [Hyphomicrobium sp. D-2]MDH4981000.1 LysR family transcriptional regulator [Hyphomicrobium sp. D-2]
MNFKSLRAFQLIVERGSLSAAAGDLCLSQPAVSRLIAQLESELGLVLFNRTGRGLTMSKEGKLFYDTTKDILAGVDEIPRIAKEIQHGGRHLQLLAGSHIARAVVSPALAMLQREGSKLRCRLDVISDVGLDELSGGRHFDLAIAPITSPVVPPHLEAHRLFSVRVEAVVPRSHRLASRNAISVSDLADEDLIIPRQEESYGQQISRFANRGASAKTFVETQSSLIACQMACDGVGIALFDRLSARGLHLGSAQFIPLEPDFWMTFAFLHPRGEALRTGAVAFVDAVRQVIADFIVADPLNAAAVRLE